MRRRGLVLLMLSAALVIAAPLGAVTAPSGIDPRLRLEWDVADGGGGRPTIAGYIYNDHGRAAINVRLLAETLDAAGQVVDRTIAFVPGNVPPSGRSYFTVPLKMSGSYRIVVTAFEWKESSF